MRLRCALAFAGRIVDVRPGLCFSAVCSYRLCWLMYLYMFSLFYNLLIHWWCVIMYLFCYYICLLVRLSRWFVLGIVMFVSVFRLSCCFYLCMVCNVVFVVFYMPWLACWLSVFIWKFGSRSVWVVFVYVRCVPGALLCYDVRVLVCICSFMLIGVVCLCAWPRDFAMCY